MNAEMAAALESGEAVIWPVHPYVLKRNTIYTHDLSTRPNITDLILSCSWDAKHHLHAWNATISLRKQGLKQLPVIPSLHICYFFRAPFSSFLRADGTEFPQSQCRLRATATGLLRRNQPRRENLSACFREELRPPDRR